MIERIADIDRAVRADADAVRPSQLSLRCRAAITRAALLPVAGHGRYDAPGDVDFADGLVLGIDHVHLSLRTDSDPLGPVEASSLSRSAVTAVAHLAGAGNVPQPAIRQVHPPHAVTFAERNPHRRTVDKQRARAEDRIPQRR